MNVTHYKGFQILHFKAHDTGRYFKIYQDSEYMHTSKTLKDAKRFIDWCLDRGVWHD